jgi:hypothetical protein
VAKNGAQKQDTGTFIMFCHRSSISILVRTTTGSTCVQDRPVESEDTVLPGTVFPRNITVIFATLVARRRVAKSLHALFVDLPPNP